MHTYNGKYALFVLLYYCPSPGLLPFFEIKARDLSSLKNQAAGVTDWSRMRAWEFVREGRQNEGRGRL